MPENESELVTDAGEEQNDAAGQSKQWSCLESNVIESKPILFFFSVSDDDSFTPKVDEDADLHGANSVEEEVAQEADKDEPVQPEAELQQAPVPKIHSKKFRE